MGFRPDVETAARSGAAGPQEVARPSVELETTEFNSTTGEESTLRVEQEFEEGQRESDGNRSRSRLARMARKNRKRQGRRFMSARQIGEEKMSKVGVMDWVKRISGNSQGCALDGVAWEPRGLEAGLVGSGMSQPLVGAGGGVGAPIPPNGVEPSPVKEGDEADKGTDAPVVQQGMQHQAIPPAQRRREPDTTVIQKQFLPVINSDAFYYVIMGAIALNCLQLACMSPLDPSPDPQIMQDLNVAIDILLFVVFSVEFVIKHLALYPAGYWADPWNKLDGTIVIVGYLKYIPGVGEYPAIRVLRIIRPLRVIGKLEGMKKILVTIGAAFDGLKDTLLLCCLIFFMFGIIGCTLFAGVTRHRCMSSSLDSSNNTVWSTTDDERPCGGWHKCRVDGEKCMFNEGAAFADAVPTVVNFDNILTAFLNLFVMITLEGWVDVMYLIQDGYGYWGSTIVFHFLILFGSLFVLNLALAVISDAYENQEEDWEPAERNATFELRLVMLDDEARALEDLGYQFRAETEEKEGLENAVEFADTPEEEDKINDELDASNNKLKAVSANVGKIADMLDAQPDGCCAKEAILVRIMADLMDAYLEQEEEVPELSDEQVLEQHTQIRQGMASWQAAIHLVATNWWFDKLIMFFIIFNTLVLAMEHTREEYVDGIKQATKMPTDMSDALTSLNYLFIVVFTGEVLVKGPGLGLRVYLIESPEVSWNRFDVFIVIMSYVELAFAGNSSLSALRTMRLARVAKLAKSWKKMQQILNTILDTLPAMSYLSILLMLFMFIASVAGMMFFGGEFQENVMDAEDGRRNLFDNFGISMLTVFQMLTGENWNSVLNDGIRWTSWACVPYFLVVQILGGFVILNLFLAILLGGFGDEDEEEDAGGFPSLADITSSCFTTAKVEPLMPEKTEAPTPEPDTKADDAAVAADSGNGASSEAEAGKGTGAGSTDDAILPKAKRDFSDPGSRSVAALNAEIRRRDEEEKARPPIVPCIADMDVQGTALFCFPPDDTLRRHLALLVGWTPKGEESRATPFANFIFAMIIISSITLAMDEPILDKDAPLKTALNALDVVFTAIFLFEMVAKIIVHGFWFTEDAYLKDGWNCLDFFIVVTSVLALPSNAILGGGDNSPVASLRVLRTFRALRPLRMINRAPGLKVVVDAIFVCLPSFISIALVTSVVYLVFAIMGVQLWSGKFWSCNDGDVANVTECIGTMADGTPRVWDNKPLNFDNVLKAMLTLYEVSTLEIWLDVMYAAMDVPEKLGDQPKKNQSWFYCFYFVIFIVIGSFIMMNLFVGAVVDNFNKIKGEMDKKGAVMTPEQEAFVQSMKTMFNKKPAPKATPPDKDSGIFGLLRYKIFRFITDAPRRFVPEWWPECLHPFKVDINEQIMRMRGKLAKLGEGAEKEAKKAELERLRAKKADAEATSTADDLKMHRDELEELSIRRRKGETSLFDHVIMFLIATNILVMAAPVWVMPPAGTEVGSKEDIEAQKTDWNTGLESCNAVFNFLFVIEAVLKLTGLGFNQYFSVGMNTFDFCIVTVSVVGFVVDQALENVDPGLISIISVIKAGRVVRIFRLAMRVKGIRKLLETLIYTLPSLANVAALLVIILFIFTVLGMAFFGDQQYNQPPFELYTEHANFRTFRNGFFTLFRMSTGESWNGIMHDSMDQVSKQAYIFYVAYMIVGSDLLFNLIVAVVLEQFSSAAAEEDDSAVVKPDDIDNYRDAWLIFDRSSTHLIDFGTLPSFLKALDEPLGLPRDATTADVMDFMKESRLMSHGGKAHYVETFFSLVMFAYKNKYGTRWKGTLDEDMLIEMTKTLTEGFPTIATVDSGSADTAVSNFAALKIQSITRKRQAAKRSAGIREQKGLPPLEAKTMEGEVQEAPSQEAPSQEAPTDQAQDNGPPAMPPMPVEPPMPAPRQASALDSPRAAAPPPSLPQIPKEAEKKEEAAAAAPPTE